MERPDIVISRRIYLRKKRQLENEYPNSVMVYLDETFVHQNIVNDKLLVCDNELPPIKISSGKGSRFIILHCGSKNGWINSGELVFKVNKTYDDYQSESFRKVVKGATCT